MASMIFFIPPKSFGFSNASGCNRWISLGRFFQIGLFLSHCVWNASMWLKCVIVSEMRRCVWNASLYPKCVIVSEMRHCAWNPSLCLKCVVVSEMRHCAWNPSLCLKCVVVSEMRHCVWNASVSLRYLPGTERPNLYPKSFWRSFDSSSRVRSIIWIKPTTLSRSDSKIRFEPTTLSRSESKIRIEPMTLSRSGPLVSGFGKWPAFQSKPAQQQIICSLVLYWGKQVSCIPT